MPENSQNPPSPSGSEWSLPRRIAFRFCFLFLSLIFLPFPLALYKGTEIVAEIYASFWQQVVPWVGTHLLGVSGPLVGGPSGSGDRLYDWVLLFCQALFSLLGAAAWSALDRRRTIGRWWVEGLAIYLRYGLAFAMIDYGLAKIFPNQFPPVGYDQLVAPLGRFSPMGLLWAFMGASEGYTRFAGALEVIGGALLLFRRTTLLGALVCAGVMTNVLALNLFYDVPVKRYSAQLLLTALYLALPDARRLAAIFLLNRPAPARDLSMPGVSRRFRIGAWVAKAALVIPYFLIFEYVPNFPWHSKEPPPLYGIYEVESFEVVEPLPAVLLEPKPWRRVLFGRYRNFAAQRLDDSTLRFTVKAVDEASGRIELTTRSSKRVVAFERAGEERIILRGRFEETQVVVRLRRVAEPKFELTSRGFRWIIETPYNYF